MMMILRSQDNISLASMKKIRIEMICFENKKPKKNLSLGKSLSFF
jgi:hypothetical protein